MQAFGQHLQATDLQCSLVDSLPACSTIHPEEVFLCVMGLVLNNSFSLLGNQQMTLLGMVVMFVRRMHYYDHIWSDWEAAL